jgi:hypothetical protein
MRLRWRRVCIAGTPVLAAAVVAAAVLAVTAAPVGPGSRPGPATSGPGPAVAPGRFNPLTPSASFGWLPVGQSPIYAIAGRAEIWQSAGPNPNAVPWVLEVFAVGRCKLSAPANVLNCLGDQGNLTTRLIRPAPNVRGHRAFWAHTGSGYHTLAWQYAPGGWAVLRIYPVRQSVTWRQVAVKVADHIRHGLHAAPPLAFATQLTQVPASWQVSSVEFRTHGTVSQAFQYEVHPGGGFGPSRIPIYTVDTELAALRIPCQTFPHGESAREVINGYRVIISHLSPFRQELCAANADGLLVRIDGMGLGRAVNVVGLFAHHLRLLGPNPARWARKPVG